MSPRRMSPSDILVVLVAIAAIGGLYAGLWRPAQPGARVEIRAAAGDTRTLPLDTARTVKIDGRLGASTLRIRDGQVRFTDSPCRNKVCVHSGWLGTSGAFAACLPNGVSVEVVGSTHGFDAINY